MANGEAADTPRLRPSKDKTGEKDAEWFAAQEMDGAEFPIDDKGNKLINTNVPYEQLPPSWQEANSGAADFVVNTLVGKLENGVDIRSDESVEAAASAVHDKWMEDNAWQRDSTPELFVPYEDLPEDEKKKDRDQVLLATAHLI